MKCTMFWHGGSSYAVFDTSDKRDAIVCDSIADAVSEFKSRAGSDPYFPCVSDDTQEDGGPSAWLFFGDKHPVLGGDYPDRIIEFGPRGGVRVTEA